MGMISKETINEVKVRAKIVDIVSETVALRRQGSGLVGLCPFHSEKSPSFHVRDDDNYYHCFGCGVSGNVFSFLMETRGLSFPEAVEDLAGRLGIEVKYEGRREKQEAFVDRELLYRINKLAAQYFSANLEKAPKLVKDYAVSRGLSADVVKAFSIGFAPEGRDALAQILRKQKVSEETMLQTGLVRRGQSGELYDTFRARLIFPVYIDPRRIAGFGGRIIPELLSEEQRQNLPKYLNSPETPIYQKKRIFYGLPLAMDAIRQTKTVYMVEGYMDVIGLWRAGVKNVLATCGTAVSEQHIQRLSQLARKVNVLFDGDSAGREAAAKTFSLFLGSGLDASALFLPEEDDPDSIAQRLGDGTAKYLADIKPTPLIDCFVDSLIRKQGEEDAKSLGAGSKGKVAESVAAMVSKVANSVERNELLRRAAFKLLLDPGELLSMVDPKAARPVQPEPPTSSPADEQSYVLAERKEIDELPTVDRELLLAVMARKETLADRVLRDPDLCLGLQPTTIGFVTELNKIMLEDELKDVQKRDDILALLKGFGRTWVGHWKKAYQMSTDPEVDFDKTFNECRKATKKIQLNQMVKRLQDGIAKASTDEEKIQLSDEVMALRRQLSSGG